MGSGTEYPEIGAEKPAEKRKFNMKYLWAAVAVVIIVIAGYFLITMDWSMFAGEPPKTNFQLAEETGDSSYCEGISDSAEKDACLMNLAQTIMDPSICRMVSDSEMVNLCIGVIAKLESDPDLCEEITVQSQKEECYLNLAMSKGMIELCEMVSNGDDRDNCYFSASSRSGTFTSQTCEKILNQTLRDACNSAVGEVMG